MRKIWILGIAVALGLCSLLHAQTANVAEKTEPKDPSKWFDLILAAQAGSGLDAQHDPTAHANIKIGASPVVVDLGYDRIQAQDGFSFEMSGLVPLFRIPGPQRDETKHYVRFYAEPGMGYRAGGSPFGGYASAKVMAALMSDYRIYRFQAVPYVEYQRRFPFNSPLQGDNRLAIGVMVPLCHHCGLD